MKRDGHIHSPYCPHGTSDQWVDYVETAIQWGYVEISFTEHAPLPHGFKDPTPLADSAMKPENLPKYLNELEKIKQFYRKKIKINVGLEVDYIEAYEKETKDFLNEVGPQLDDAILSVHFLKKDLQYYCVDYSPDEFSSMIRVFQSVDEIYRIYYETLRCSLFSDLGAYKPKRIGHMTLVRKFHKRFPPKQRFKKDILTILDIIKEKDYELDWNGAGTVKPLCQESYPPSWVADEARKRSIPLVYGSDAHRVKELNQGKEMAR
ncbi:histidinol-phosphatase HisJ [Hazenella sp. IB182357]|uniref:Histidinol-phosphatase n=1 Tax=Polycladospora coralii TaxID=2771432 RepID=A0A926NFS7_9BACL|nr:histidinol-phosphatase HisJ [Polycladospora coralii]MBD1372744.1 histidinol-phosphatase HisJ [Polycladospora coralii]